MHMEEPRRPDHYYNLGIKSCSTVQEIKQAFFRLAKVHHPDKQAQGLSKNAEKFRKIREGQETLCDDIKRRNYDLAYPGIQLLWIEYRNARVNRPTAHNTFSQSTIETARRNQEEWLAHMAKRERIVKNETEAEERSREAGPKAWERQEQEAKERLREYQRKQEEQEAIHRIWLARERKAARDRERIQIIQHDKAEQERIYQEHLQKEQERIQEEADVETERRLKEEARLWTDQMKRESDARLNEANKIWKEMEEKEAKGRLSVERERMMKCLERMDKEKQAEMRSVKAAGARREEQETEAKDRLVNTLAAERQWQLGRAWSTIREEARLTEQVRLPRKEEHSNSVCIHPSFGWPRRKGSVDCNFCGSNCLKFSFRCPTCNVAARIPCKNKHFSTF